MTKWLAKLVRPIGALLIALVVVSGCADAERVTAPAEDIEAQQLLGLGGLLGPNGLLKNLLGLELQRINLQRTLNDVSYLALKPVWEIYSKGTYPLIGSPLLVCEPQRYTAETKVIGWEGGEIRIGPHRLIIPRGALTRRTVITGELLTALNVQVRFSPHGLRFRRKPLLYLSYEHCLRPPGFDPQLVYVDDEGSILEWLTGSNQNGGVAGWIEHFSRYSLSRSKYGMASN
ncbi:MAG: hypothetical protein ACRELX_10720 [Longimicrobiales bacterium]